MGNADDKSGKASRERASIPFVWVLVALAVLAFWFLRSGSVAEMGLDGAPMPPLEVGGWFNTATPVTNESLRGKVVLVDFWFVDCPPCRASMPKLVQFREKFRGQGLEVIGLTPDAGPDVPRAEEFVRSVSGLDWPIGYQAEVPLNILGVRSFPTMILFDKSGQSVWAGHGLTGLKEAVVKALAAPG